jgi:hypothetical protein
VWRLRLQPGATTNPTRAIEVVSARPSQPAKGGKGAYSTGRFINQHSRRSRSLLCFLPLEKFLAGTDLGDGKDPSSMNKDERTTMRRMTICSSLLE